MPPRRNTPAAAEPAPGTALTIPQDVRADLLRTQAEELGERRLPRIAVMPAGAGLYEFKDTSDTTPTFNGVILGSHARNVLWDEPFGSQPQGSEPRMPACSSNDGKVGIPREGFFHAALEREATADDRVQCVYPDGKPKCPYNRWKSKGLIPALLTRGQDPATVKGKAVQNQRSVIVMVEGRITPMELILSPTGLTPYDEYVQALTAQGLPIQAVWTVFRQERKGGGSAGPAYAMPTFEKGATLTQEQFDSILEQRTRYLPLINPEAGGVEGEAEAVVERTAVGADEVLPNW